jgi:thiol-disulfide isomerase/thioredoxin
VELPFRASRSAPKAPALAAGAPSLSGDWAIEIGGAGSLEKTHGVLSQKGSVLSGTLLTTTGDYGPLHGTFDGSALVLTVFDGVHVYRFDGSPQPDGTLVGEFRSRANPPVPWIGRRLGAAEAAAYLPDGFSVVRPKNPGEPYRFSFPDSSGNVVSSTDPRFAGKPILVAFMGTWCPNCNDEAPVLKELYATYRARGLEIVSLAFEYTDDVERSRRQVKRFLSRYGIQHPVLIAGTTKSAPSSEAMTQLDGWQGYPTTLFLDRSHKVVKIHSGFDGPATGARYGALKKEMAEAIEGLLR